MKESVSISMTKSINWKLDGSKLYWLEHNYPTSISDAFASGYYAALDDDEESEIDGDSAGGISHAQLHSIDWVGANIHVFRG